MVLCASELNFFSQHQFLGSVKGSQSGCFFSFPLVLILFIFKHWRKTEETGKSGTEGYNKYLNSLAILPPPFETRPHLSWSPPNLHIIPFTHPYLNSPKNLWFNMNNYHTVLYMFGIIWNVSVWWVKRSHSHSKPKR